MICCICLWVVDHWFPTMIWTYAISDQIRWMIMIRCVKRVKITLTRDMMYYWPTHCRPTLDRLGLTTIASILPWWWAKMWGRITHHREHNPVAKPLRKCSTRGCRRLAWICTSWWGMPRRGLVLALDSSCWIELPPAYYYLNLSTTPEYCTAASRRSAAKAKDFRMAPKISHSRERELQKARMVATSWTQHFPQIRLKKLRASVLPSAA